LEYGSIDDDRQRRQAATTMSRKHQLGAFFLAVDSNDDFIAVTVDIPRTFMFPVIGTVSAELVGLATITLSASIIVWKGYRTYCHIRNYMKDKLKPLEIEQAKESPVKAKKWEKVNSTKLYDFIDSCKDAKKGLRKVEDPDTVAKRIERRNKIKEVEKVKPKGKLALSDDLLQNTRGGLKSGGLVNLVQKDVTAKNKLRDERRRTVAQDEGTPLLQKHRAGLRSGLGCGLDELVLKDAANHKNTSLDERRDLKDQDRKENIILDYRALLKTVD
jgi:hypothetical protein